MKKLYLLLFSLTLFSCSNLSDLSERIYEVQKEHLTKSSYIDTKKMLPRIRSQRRFRSQQLPVIFRDLVNQRQLTDTLIILEDFDDLCVNCPSSRMQLLYQDTLYFMRLKMTGNKADYVGFKVKLDSSFTDTNKIHDFDELLEVKGKMKRNENWMSNPLEYGSKHCWGGNHSFLTTIYPDGNIKSIYVRCWIPEWRRKLQKE